MQFVEKWRVMTMLISGLALDQTPITGDFLQKIQ